MGEQTERDPETRWELTLLYDGDCPLCRREVALLRRRDARGALRLVDIAAEDFDPTPYGVTLERLMARIHGLTPEGQLVEGMEVFRRAYAAVGLGWLLAPSRWPLLGPLFDAAYAWFARHRLRLTGRTPACDEHCERAPSS